MKTVIAAAGIDPKEKRFPKAEVVADIFSMAINTEPRHRGTSSTKSTRTSSRSGRRDPATDAQTLRGQEEGHQHDGLRRPARKDPQAAARASRHRRDLPEAVPVRAGGRVPGHQPHPGRVRGHARRASTRTSWSSATTRSRSTRGAGRTSRTSSSSPSATRTRSTFKIETNYRSVPEILQVANAAIAANVNQFPKNLQAARDTALGQARADRTQRQQPAGALRHAAHPRTARRGGRTQRDRRALPRAFPLDGTADSS